ncbi:MAG: hypothetical protein AAGD33_23575, partial [Actinomycetota bacterium]
TPLQVARLARSDVTAPDGSSADAGSSTGRPPERHRIHHHHIELANGEVTACDAHGGVPLGETLDQRWLLITDPSQLIPRPA